MATQLAAHRVAARGRFRSWSCSPGAGPPSAERGHPAQSENEEPMVGGPVLVPWDTTELMPDAPSGHTFGKSALGHGKRLQRGRAPNTGCGGSRPRAFQALQQRRPARRAPPP